MEKQPFSKYAITAFTYFCLAAFSTFFDEFTFSKLAYIKFFLILVSFILALLAVNKIKLTGERGSGLAWFVITTVGAFLLFFIGVSLIFSFYNITL